MRGFPWGHPLWQGFAPLGMAFLGSRKPQNPQNVGVQNHSLVPTVTFYVPLPMYRDNIGDYLLYIWVIYIYTGLIVVFPDIFIHVVCSHGHIIYIYIKNKYIIYII